MLTPAEIFDDFKNTLTNCWRMRLARIFGGRAGDGHWHPFTKHDVLGLVSAVLRVLTAELFEKFSAS